MGEFAGEDPYNARLNEMLIYLKNIKGVVGRAVECKRVFRLDEQQAH